MGMGMGMAVDCSALLTSDFTADIVAGVSLLGPAGMTPTGESADTPVTAGAAVVSGFAFGADGSVHAMLVD